jgi:hypothetical protein
MFCPKCKCEYRDGFYECADCNMPLVVELPEEAIDIQFKELKATGNPAEISYLQSVFEAEGIQFNIVSVNANALYGGGPGTLFVATNDYERALEIVSTLTWSDK